MTANERLTEQLNNARTMILETIEGLDDDTLSNTVVSGSWTARDVFGHLVSWGDEFRREVRTILSESPSYDYAIRSDDHFNEWNLGEAEKKKAMSWQDALDDFERDHREMTDLLTSLTKAQVDTKGPVPWGDKQVKVETVIKIHPKHITHHAKILKKWRKGL